MVLGKVPRQNFCVIIFEDNKDSVILTKEPTEDSESGRMVRKVLRKEEKIEPDELQKSFCSG